jgi:hypothetical protein
MGCISSRLIVPLCLLFTYFIILPFRHGVRFTSSQKWSPNASQLWLTTVKLLPTALLLFADLSLVRPWDTEYLSCKLSIGVLAQAVWPPKFMVNLTSGVRWRVKKKKKTKRARKSPVSQIKWLGWEALLIEGGAISLSFYENIKYSLDKIRDTSTAVLHLSPNRPLLSPIV